MSASPLGPELIVHTLHQNLRVMPRIAIPVSGIDGGPDGIRLGSVRPMVRAVAANHPLTLLNYNEVPQPRHARLLCLELLGENHERRIAMRQIVLPPEMLPSTGAEDEAEVVICRGPPRCDGQGPAPCPFCVRVNPGESGDVEAILRSMDITH